MTYPIIKKVASCELRVASSRQAGVTLLLAILILSSVLAISFSLAAVLFTEIRTSGDLLKTEPALYAATGVGEQALFDLERNACPGNGANCYVGNFSNGVTMPTTPAVAVSANPTFTDRVKTGAIFGNTPNNYSFCAGAGTGGCGYGKATVNYIPSNNTSDPLYVYMCEFDDTGNTNYPSVPCTATGTATGTTQGYWKAPDNSFPQNSDGSVTLIPGSPSVSSVSWTITNSALQQELILTNPAGSKDIFAQVKTFSDQSGLIGKGLPFLGKTAINIATLNSVVGRNIQVVAPNSSGKNLVIPQNVSWTNVVGVSVSGNSLTKTAPTGWGNAGASSVQGIPSGDGYVEFSTNENDHGKVTGFSHVDADQNFTSIDFGMNTGATGFINIYEKGVLVASSVSNFVAGDTFRVSVESGVVKYYKNSRLLYTSSTAPVYPLYFDTSLNHSGGTITNAKIAF